MIVIYGEDYQDYFSSRLTKLRMKKDVSAREMSLAIGQSEGYIAQIERKHNLPSMTVFFYICEYLHIKPNEFFDEDVEFPATYSELLNNLKDLDDEQMKNINSIVKGLKKNAKK